MEHLDQPLAGAFSTLSGIETQGLGLLVLSSALHILHTNEQAPSLLQRLRELQTPGHPDGRHESGLPVTVHALCEEVQRTLLERGEQEDWRPFELSKTVGSVNNSMHLRAFVFPSRASLAQTRILVTLQEL